MYTLVAFGWTEDISIIAASVALRNVFDFGILDAKELVQELANKAITLNILGYDPAIKLATELSSSGVAKVVLLRAGDIVYQDDYREALSSFDAALCAAGCARSSEVKD